MSILIDIPAALVASPRPCAPMAWRDLTSSMKRGYDTVAEHTTQDGRTAFAGAAYVTKQHVTIRSGPSTSRPPA